MVAVHVCLRERVAFQAIGHRAWVEAEHVGQDRRPVGVADREVDPDETVRAAQRGSELVGRTVLHALPGHHSHVHRPQPLPGRRRQCIVPVSPGEDARARWCVPGRARSPASGGGRRHTGPLWDPRVDAGMTVGEMVAVALAGLAAGSINAVVGSGTLVTFPVLLAVGLPPVTATISNSLGLVPGNLTGAIGYRRELRGQRRLLVRLFPASVLGALTGAFLLLHLPAAAFEAIVPALVALAVVLVAVQPLLQRGLAAGRARAGTTDEAHLGRGRLAALVAGAYATGTYGGYFAASQGVLQIGIFGLLLHESLQRLNAIKNVLTLAVNAVAAGAYVVVATDRVDWRAAGLVAAGSLLGGYVGARFGRRLPSAVLRGAIVALGCGGVPVLLSRCRSGRRRCRTPQVHAASRRSTRQAGPMTGSAAERFDQ